MAMKLSTWYWNIQNIAYLHTCSYSHTIQLIFDIVFMHARLRSARTRLGGADAVVLQSNNSVRRTFLRSLNSYCLWRGSNPYSPRYRPGALTNTLFHLFTNSSIHLSTHLFFCQCVRPSIYSRIHYHTDSHSVPPVYGKQFPSVWAMTSLFPKLVQ